LNLLLAIDDATFMVTNQIFNSLIERAFMDRQLGYKGDLAEEWGREGHLVSQPLRASKGFSTGSPQARCPPT